MASFGDTGWSIWVNGMWDIADDDMDNIPGIAADKFGSNGRIVVPMLDGSSEQVAHV